VDHGPLTSIFNFEMLGGHGPMTSITKFKLLGGYGTMLTSMVP